MGFYFFRKPPAEFGNRILSSPNHRVLKTENGRVICVVNTISGKTVWFARKRGDIPLNIDGQIYNGTLTEDGRDFIIQDQIKRGEFQSTLNQFHF